MSVISSNFINSHRSRSHRSLTAALLVGMIFSLAACNLSGTPPLDCHSDQFFGYAVPIPEGASSVQESCNNGLNPTYTASFIIPVSGLVPFQQSQYVNQITDWQSTVPANSQFNDEAAKATSLLYGTYSDGAILLEVLIDSSNPDQYTVYLLSSNVD